MKQAVSHRWIWLLVLAGVVIFSMATILAEPFEKETAEELVAAIGSNQAAYRTVNLLGVLGIGILLLGFARLAFLLRDTNRPVFLITLGLFLAAFVFWVIEIISRFMIAASAGQPSGSNLSPASGMGIGFNPMFLGFFTSVLLGTALLVWWLGKAGVISFRIAAIAAVIVLASGVVAVIFYPWVGGVERVYFYPLFLIVLPMGISFLFRRRTLARGMSH